MQPSTNLLINEIRKAGRFLQRDFVELEMLQSSARNTKGFCERSYARTKDALSRELSNRFKNIFFADEQILEYGELDNILLVEPIEGVENLSKGLPFFAIMVTLVKRIAGKHAAHTTVVYFPAFAEIYYAEKGAGSWAERLSLQGSTKAERLRVSSCSNLEGAFICGDERQELANISSNIRHFGSNCYSVAALFASGKIDLIYYAAISSFIKPGLELIIKEAGGTIIASSDGLVAANYNLAEKLKQFLAKN